MSARYEIRTMSLEDVERAVCWAAAEGWNPGHADAACFTGVDAQGFMGGWLGGRMIASISVVNYDAAFSFLGFYIVEEGERGNGYGLRLWQHAIAHAGERVVGLDGVPAEQENYRRSGFELAYRNVRYGGAAPAAAALAQADPVSAVTIAPLGRASPELLYFDGQVFPAERARFLEDWLTAPGHVASASFEGGALSGYGAIRPCCDGYKIGPLFAANRTSAEALLADLLRRAGIEAGSAEIFLDVPEPNGEAASLARHIGLVPVFETARMYRGRAPVIALDKVFGVTTFELG